MENTINKHLSAQAVITEDDYKTLYQQSIQDPETFWAKQAEQLEWIEPWQTVLTGSFEQTNVRWFESGKLNACYNCLDRHLPQRANQTAIIWQGDEPDTHKKITYQELHDDVCRFANALKKLGLKKGDRLCLYMPMIPEAAIAMLACARLGIIHTVVFAGFSPESLKKRIQNADCKAVITADESVRGGKHFALKENVDQAVAECPSIEHVIVVKHLDTKIQWQADRDHWYHDLTENMETNCTPATQDANDPLFILYTSGSTGTPKGILHSTAGYLLYATTTFKTIFDYRDDDIYWCTADVGWITGHSYIVYGPLANGATLLMYEGIPTYPTPARFWEIIDQHQVTIFYTAPTAIRALMREGDDFVTQTQRTSLRILGTVGEPINPDVWRWYYEVVGNKNCPIVDTWWQTETGGIAISPFPGATPLKPGSASYPFFGIEVAVLDENYQTVAAGEPGNLVITKPWPGQLLTVFGDHERFVKTYFSTPKGQYCTGDTARIDEDGYIWIIGRNDDVINVSGHRLGTAEIESALVSHPLIAEAAVVDFPHKIKGQGIYAFVTVMANTKTDDHLRDELIQRVRDEIGAIATPEIIQWAPELPKTRSGKIMRRILRKIAHHDTDDLGDVSTLANPEVVREIIQQSHQ